MVESQDPHHQGYTQQDQVAVDINFTEDYHLTQVHYCGGMYQGTRLRSEAGLGGLLNLFARFLKYLLLKLDRSCGESKYEDSWDSGDLQLPKDPDIFSGTNGHIEGTGGVFRLL